MDQILYLHGFRSSPNSLKAVQFSEYCAKNLPNVKLVIPQLDVAPKKAIEQCIDIIESFDGTTHIIGSSLGGFYANYLSDRYGIKAVGINPAVAPHDSLKDYLGPQTTFYNEEVIVWLKEHLQQLQILHIKQQQKPENYLLLVQTGDETLDAQQAIDYFSRSPSIIEPGGDHSYQNFDQRLHSIRCFFNL